MLLHNIGLEPAAVNGNFITGFDPIGSDDPCYKEDTLGIGNPYSADTALQSVSPKTRLRLQAVKRLLLGREYNLKKLPPIGYWRNAYGLKLSSAVLLYRFQFDFQTGNLAPPCLPTCRHVAKPASEWQVSAGLTEHEWGNALQGASMLVKADVFMVSAKKQVWLRPTEAFMGVFGLTLADYDTVGRLGRLARGGPGRGKLAQRDGPIAPEDKAAVDRWQAAGGSWK